MSGLDLLTSRGQMMGLPALPYNPTGFGDVFSSSLYSGTLQQPIGRRQLMEATAFSDRDALIRKRFGQDAVNLTGLSKKIDAFSSDPIHISAELKQSALDEHEASLDAMITQGKKADPEKWDGIRTKKEIHDSVIDEANFEQQVSENIAFKAPTTKALAGQILGGLGAAFTDPINIATLFVGAGAGIGILRAMGMEALLNAGIETLEQPLVASWQKELGHKYGIGDAALNIATAGVGGGVLTGLIRGGGRALRGFGDFVDGRGMRILDAMSRSEKLPSKVRDAAQYMSRVAHIDEGIPFPDLAPSPRDRVAANRAAVAETQDAFKNYREPVYSIKENPAPITDRDHSIATIKKMVDAVQSARSAAPNTPLLNYLRELGGVKVGSELDGELRSMGINPKTAPGLFRKNGGRGALDNLPASEFESRFGVGGVPTDGTSYVNQAYLVDAIRNEQFGKSLSGDSLKGHDQDTAERFIEELDRLGIDINKATPDEIFNATDQTTIIKRVAAEMGLPDPIEAEIRAVKETLAGNQRYEVEEAINYVYGRPTEALVSMQRDADLGESTEVKDAFDAEFQRALNEDPDFEIMDENGDMMRLSDISESLSENRKILDAIRTCAIG